MPRVAWVYSSGKRVKAIALARETGELFVADDDRGLTRIDCRGELSSITRLPRSARVVTVSDDGQFGSAVIDYGHLFRFDRALKGVWEHEFDEPCMAIAMTPFGFHTAIALSNGITEILNERKRRISKFETVRPLAAMEFCTREPLLYGAAEHGLVGCFELSGGDLWQERFWSNVTDMAMTGDGDLLYLAAAAHGVQTLDGDGATVGAYVVDGTVRRVAASFEPRRVAATTVERRLFLMDAQGEVIWSVETPDDVVDIACDAFGDELTVAIANGDIYRFDWGGI